MKTPTSCYTKRISNPLRRSTPTKTPLATNVKTNRKVVRP